ncbi:MAG: hypothetical protein Q8S00_11240 [Deltaproteobacteria bacterium]|nr:hypothetical protein [Deltaproteobacteria bacterium]MDZ4344290.1 hypothetical protein [Candidatus Binatia bacterium]
MAEGLGMTVKQAIIPNEARVLGQNEPRPTDERRLTVFAGKGKYHFHLHCAKGATQRGAERKET